MGAFIAWFFLTILPTTQDVPEEFHPRTLPQKLGAAAIWVAMGIVLLVLGYKIFDWVLRRVDFDAELNKGNIAVAIVVAAFILGIAMIIRAAIS